MPNDKKDAEKKAAGGKKAGEEKKEKKAKKSQKERPKSKQKHKKVQIWKFYKVASGKISKTNEECPRCGPGTFLARYKNRKFCGKCGWSQVIKEEAEKEKVKGEEKAGAKVQERTEKEKKEEEKPGASEEKKKETAREEKEAKKEDVKTEPRATGAAKKNA